jgi:hypothetical protein
VENTMIKKYKDFLNENSNSVTVAKIRYGWDNDEIDPLFAKGIKYFLRYGDTTTEYSEHVMEPREDLIVLPNNYFNDMNVNFIESEFYTEYVEELGYEPQEFWKTNNG